MQPKAFERFCTCPRCSCSAVCSLNGESRISIATSSPQCLAQLFPDGINGKYACWFRLLGCTGFIVVNGIAQNGGKLPGFGPKKSPEPTPEHGAATPA